MVLHTAKKLKHNAWLVNIEKEHNLVNKKAQTDVWMIAEQVAMFFFKRSLSQIVVQMLYKY